MLQKLQGMVFGETTLYQLIIHTLMMMNLNLRFGLSDSEILGAVVLTRKDLPIFSVETVDR